jgi:hypothetical protein
MASSVIFIMALLLVVLVLANLLYHIDAELFSCGELWVITTSCGLDKSNPLRVTYAQLSETKNRLEHQATC